MILIWLVQDSSSPAFGVEEVGIPPQHVYRELSADRIGIVKIACHLKNSFSLSSIPSHWHLIDIQYSQSNTPRMREQQQKYNL